MSRGLAHRVRRLEKRPVDVDAFSRALQRYVEHGVLPQSETRLAQAVSRYAERMENYLSKQDDLAHEALKGEQA